MTSSDLVFSGAAASFAWGCPDHPPYTEAQIAAIVKAREVFEGMTIEEMGAALLVLLLDLGRRIEQ